MFGRDTAPYQALHVRMGDAAEGAAFDRRSVPRKDIRFSHATALHMIRCVRAQSNLPIYVATDNAALKQAIRTRSLAPLSLQNAAITRGSKQVASKIFDRVVTTGCVGCMINPVWHHNFSYESVAEIYIEIGKLCLLNISTCPWQRFSSAMSPCFPGALAGLLAKGECLYRTNSNFGAVSEAWRGDQCSIFYMAKKNGLGRCNVALPSDPQ